jgi:two-component system, LytTR family, response regulator
MIRAIIIDDEAYGRTALRLALEKYFPEVSIVCICDTPERGLVAIRQEAPNLVFLDVQMPGMSGFDLLKLVSPFNFEVIFVTAYEQYAIKAIRFSALDYLMKPVDIDDLRASLQKAKERLSRANTHHQYQSVLHNIQHPAGKIERLAVPTQEGINFFNLSQVIFCKAEGSYTQMMLVHGQSHLVTRNLKDFENLLLDSGFCRVHHTYLINMAHIRKYIRGEGGYVIMTDDHHIDISRRKKEEFLKLLDKV